MVGHTSKNKEVARKAASSARKRGLKASIYKKRKGYGVSVTKKKK